MQVPDSEETELDDHEQDPRITAYEEHIAQQRVAAINAGRRKGGAAGAAMAASMLALRDIVEVPKDDAPVTVEASSDPHDLEKQGFGASVDGVDVQAPPLDRVAPLARGRKRR